MTDVLQRGEDRNEFIILNDSDDEFQAVASEPSGVVGVMDGALADVKPDLGAVRQSAPNPNTAVIQEAIPDDAAAAYLASSAALCQVSFASMTAPKSQKDPVLASNVGTGQADASMVSDHALGLVSRASTSNVSLSQAETTLKSITMISRDDVAHSSPSGGNSVLCQADPAPLSTAIISQGGPSVLPQSTSVICQAGAPLMFSGLDSQGCDKAITTDCAPNAMARQSDDTRVEGAVIHPLDVSASQVGVPLLSDTVHNKTTAAVSQDAHRSMSKNVIDASKEVCLKDARLPELDVMGSGKSPATTQRGIKKRKSILIYEFGSEDLSDDQSGGLTDPTGIKIEISDDHEADVVTPVVAASNASAVSCVESSTSKMVVKDKIAILHTASEPVVKQEFQESVADNVKLKKRTGCVNGKAAASSSPVVTSMVNIKQEETDIPSGVRGDAAALASTPKKNKKTNRPPAPVHQEPAKTKQKTTTGDSPKIVVKLEVGNDTFAAFPSASPVNVSTNEINGTKRPLTPIANGKDPSEAPLTATSSVLIKQEVIDACLETANPVNLVSFKGKKSCKRKRKPATAPTGRNAVEKNSARTPDKDLAPFLKRKSDAVFDATTALNALLYNQTSDFIIKVELDAPQDHPSVKIDLDSAGAAASSSSSRELSRLLSTYLSNPSRAAWEALPPDLRPPRRLPNGEEVDQPELENAHLLRLLPGKGSKNRGPDSLVIPLDSQLYDHDDEDDDDEVDNYFIGDRPNLDDDDDDEEDSQSQSTEDEEFAMQSDYDGNSSSLDEAIARRVGEISRIQDDSTEPAEDDDDDVIPDMDRDRKPSDSGASIGSDGRRSNSGESLANHRRRHSSNSNRRHHRSSSKSDRKRERKRKVKYRTLKPRMYRLSSSGSDVEDEVEVGGSSDRVRAASSFTLDCRFCRRRFVMLTKKLTFTPLRESW